MIETTVRLFDSRGRRALALGEPLRFTRTGLGPCALFGPGTVVAYVVERIRQRSVYVFRTAGPTPLTTRLDGVSRPVDLLFVCPTTRAVRKALVAMRALSRRLTSARIHGLPDLFWIRLGAVISCRNTGRIVPQLTSLLHRQASEV